MYSDMILRRLKEITDSVTSSDQSLFTAESCLLEHFVEFVDCGIIVTSNVFLILSMNTLN